MLHYETFRDSTEHLNNGEALRARLAEDGYLPPAFANRGRRLVFSHGIILLAIIAGLILVAFGGVPQKLIPLFAVGAFTAFLFSQAGMVVHWSRRPGPGVRTKLLCNLIGGGGYGYRTCHYHSC